MAVFDKAKPLTTEMLTPKYIREATAAIHTPRQSVELAKSGQAYAPTVRKVVRELGTNAMVMMIKLQMVELNLVLNLARPMNDGMIIATAPLIVDHILEDDCDITLADLRIIFDRAKKGTYGSFYGGIGSADIIAWIDGYIAEKCSEYERWHQNQYAQPAAKRSYRSEGDERNAFHEALVQYTQSRLTQGQNTEQQ